MSNRSLNIAVEGFPDEAVVSCLCNWLDIPITCVHVKHGKGNLDKSLFAYNSAARFADWFVLRDLDQDAPCAGQLKKNLLPAPSPHMIFRIAVRAVESWLMADASSFASFISVSKSRIPLQPDSVDYPKQRVIDLAKHSRSRDIREDMVPRAGSGASEGPAYASRLAEFALYHWRPNSAVRTSQSLARSIERLRAIST